MHYKFFGNHNVINFYPSFNYTFACYDRKVGGLNERTEIKSYQKFYENPNVPTKIEKGERINLEGHEVYVVKIVYDVEEDLYKVYTDKQLSLSTGNMTKDEAYAKLIEIEQEEASKNSWKSFWKRLFN